MIYKTINRGFLKWVCLTVVWIMVIFSFSMQSGEESSELSGGIVAGFVEFVFGGKFQYVEELEFFIRKLAHFTEYLVLGVLVMQTMRQTCYSKRVLVCMVASMLVCVLVASCDETIQLFSGGRCGQVKDVVLDSCGALGGVVGNWIVTKSVKLDY